MGYASGGERGCGVGIGLGGGYAGGERAVDVAPAVEAVRGLTATTKSAVGHTQRHYNVGTAAGEVEEQMEQAMVLGESYSNMRLTYTPRTPISNVSNAVISGAKPVYRPATANPVAAADSAAMKSCAASATATTPAATKYAQVAAGHREVVSVSHGYATAALEETALQRRPATAATANSQHPCSRRLVSQQGLGQHKMPGGGTLSLNPHPPPPPTPVTPSFSFQPNLIGGMRMNHGGGGGGGGGMPAGGESWRSHAPQTLKAFRGVPTLLGHIEPRVPIVRGSRPRVTVQDLQQTPSVPEVRVPPDVTEALKQDEAEAQNHVAGDASEDEDASDMQNNSSERDAGVTTPGKRMQMGFDIEMTQTAVQAAEMTAILDPARAPTGKVPDKIDGGSYAEQEAWDRKAGGGGAAVAAAYGSSRLVDLGSHAVPVGTGGAGVGGGERNGSGMNTGRPKSGFPLLRGAAQGGGGGGGVVYIDKVLDAPGSSRCT